MKLYVLKNQLTNEIIAITEYKYPMKLFCLEIGYNQKIYQLEEINKKSKINRYLIDYQDLYLVEYYNFIIREKDQKFLQDIIETERNKLKNIVSDLNSINESCIMMPIEHKKVSDVSDILSMYSKQKNIKEFINLNDIIVGYLNNHETQKILENNYYSFLYKLYANS